VRSPRDGKIVYSTDPDFARRSWDFGNLPEDCACGEVEIQGDHWDTVAADLVRRGFRVKRSGG
jgi:hypothetical protein